MAYFPDREQGQAIHTVKALWGSKPDPETNWKGYAPDWHVVAIQPDPADSSYPYWVWGWLPSVKTDGPAWERFMWKASSLSDARYDLSMAVGLPPVRRA